MDLVQHYQKYNDFLFIGPVPMDFDYKYSMGSCIVNELCTLNLNSIKNLDQ